MQDNKPFQWTDKSVVDFHKFYMGSERGTIWELLERFKASRASHNSSEKVEKDWEILTVWQGCGSYTEVDKKGKVRYGHFSDCTIEDALQNRGYSIHSVRRLSDGEVFSIGDMCDTFFLGKIEYIRVNGKHCTVGGEKWGCPLQSAKKAPIPEEKPTVKPPMELQPEYFWKQERLNEIRLAIGRFIENKKDIPQKWITEEHELRNWTENNKHKI